MGKGENDGYQHFLLFTKVFFHRVVKTWDCAVNSLPLNPRTFNDLKKKPFENIEGKGENAGNQHFLLFSTLPKTNLNFSATVNLPSANAFNLDQSKT